MAPCALGIKTDPPQTTRRGGSAPSAPKDLVSAYFAHIGGLIDVEIQRVGILVLTERLPAARTKTKAEPYWPVHDSSTRARMNVLKITVTHCQDCRIRKQINEDNRIRGEITFFLVSVGLCRVRTSSWRSVTCT